MIPNFAWCKSTVVVLLLLVGLLVPAHVMAQVDMGSISGIVRDPSGAGIPNAKVVLTNEDTNITVSTMTGSEGQYTFSPVKIGRYSVSASVTGFQTVQQKINLDISLVLGQATETVVVNAPALQTQDGSVGQVIEERAVNDLPLNGRNFTFLAQLSAGVTQAQADTRGLGASGSFAANSLRPAQNNYLLDGLDNNANLVDFLNGTIHSLVSFLDWMESRLRATR